MGANVEFEEMQHRLAKNLLRLRTAKGLSQERLALEAEVDRTYVSQLERSLKNPSLLILHRLAKVCDTNVIGLLQEET
jgi:transcriptional regulator with XRE-family HTH domain